jgi:hypothetical protein
VTTRRSIPRPDVYQWGEYVLVPQPALVDGLRQAVKRGTIPDHVRRIEIPDDELWRRVTNGDGIPRVVAYSGPS